MGFGKTTLAQLVYIEERVKKQFDIKVWVTISDAFDIVSIKKKIKKGILEGVTSRTCGVKDLYLLQVELINGSLDREKISLFLMMFGMRTTWIGVP